MTYIDLAFNLSLLVALSVVSGFIENRWSRHTRAGVLLQGVLFGGATVIAMLRPLNLGPGLILGGGSILVGLCALFFGPRAAAASGAIAFACRMWFFDAGMLTSSLVILLSAGIGLAAHFLLKPATRPPSVWSLYLFGLAVYLAWLAPMCMLPGGPGLHAAIGTSLPVLVLYPLATVLVGKILSDQLEVKRVVTTVRENEAFLNTLLDAIPIPVFYKDRSGRYLGFNRAFERFFGATKEQLIGKTVFDISPPELADIYYAKDNELFERGGVQQYQSQVLNALGVLRDVNIRKAVLSDRQGAVTGLIGAVLDITERELADRELQRSNDLLRAIIEAAPTPIIGLDLDGNVHSVWNPAAEKMLGWTAQEVMGRPLPTVPATSGEEFRSFRERIRSGKTLDGVEVRRKRRDGSPIDYSIYASALHDAEGHITGNIAVLVDVSERKRTEEEQQAHLRFLESLDQVNRAMQGTNDIDRMMSDVLDAVLTIFGCDRSWLLHPCDPEAPAWHVPMERTRPEYPGAFAMGIEIPMTEEAAKTIRTVLASDGPVIFGPGSDHPLPPDTATRFGFQSFMGMALHPKVGKPWVFGLHQCSHPRVWTRQEERLFQEIGRRLADSLRSATHRACRPLGARPRCRSDQRVG